MLTVDSLVGLTSFDAPELQITLTTPGDATFVEIGGCVEPLLVDLLTTLRLSTVTLDVDPILSVLSLCFTLLSGDCLIELESSETEFDFDAEMVADDNVAAMSSLLLWPFDTIVGEGTDLVAVGNADCLTGETT